MMGSSHTRKTPARPLFFAMPLLMLGALSALLYFAVQAGYAKLEPMINLLMRAVSLL